MATIVKKAKVHFPAAAVWRRVASPGAVPALTRDGELRKILSVDHELRRLAYRLHDAPAPIEDHAASIVVEGDDHHAVVTWTTDLSPDSAREVFADEADALFASMLARVTSDH
ncbi:MAG: hypothetical protein JJ863_33400 [Deltaproteobacteria bacterium]|nr:hypothetical protein [Deltaproteobacteria bacterium]